MTRHRVGLASVALGSVLLTSLLCAREAYGVPTFARRYKTSCATCHTVFPRLNPFGQAFRAAGYRFPAGEDEAMVKDEPIELGVDVYKEVFPDAIWPATISYLSPVSVVAKAQLALWARTGTTPDFTALEPTFDVYFTSPVGERLTMFGKLQANGPACVNCHSYFFGTVNDLWPHSTIKIGKFQPEYFSVHQQPFVEFHDVLGPARAVGSNSWNFGKDYGAEVSGVALGRGRYVAGVLEGRGNLPTAEKDVYAHLAWKFGGARLDGAPDPGYQAPTRNWRERALTVGALVYRGWGRLASNDAVGAPLTVDDDFLVGALDASWQRDDLTIFAAGVLARHAAPTGTAQRVLAERYLAGVRYVYWPWLVPEVLLDYFNSELRGDYGYQVRGRLEVLARANLKVRLEAAIARPVGEAAGFQSLGVMFDVGY